MNDSPQNEEGEDADVIDVSKKRLEGHSDPVYAVAFCPANNACIATGSGDDTAGLWNRSCPACARAGARETERDFLWGAPQTHVNLGSHSHYSLLPSSPQTC